LLAAGECGKGGRGIDWKQAIRRVSFFLACHNQFTLNDDVVVLVCLLLHARRALLLGYY